MNVPQPNPVKSCLRLTAFLLMTGVLLMPYLMLYPVRRGRNGVARLWFLGCNRLCGLTVIHRGLPTDGKHVLYVANHVSYLDIPVLGARMNCIFVAKKEVAGWPLFGLLARLARTVFVNRATMQAGAQRAKMSRRLAREHLLMFPEGTSSDGAQVLPFKSTLFSVARHGPVPGDVVVQPISITYARYADGTPLTGSLRGLYAWFGDMTLLPHLRSVFGLAGADVVVTYHEPVRAAAFATRKELAQHCEGVIARAVAAAHVEAARSHADQNHRHPQDRESDNTRLVPA